MLHPITLYFVLFARGSRRHSKRYLERALGRPVRARDLYRHVFTFSAMVLDRVYFARGHLHEFELHAHGTALMDELVAQGRGALLLGAHLGSFEALHAVGAGRPGLRVAMAMYPDNARMIHETLRAIAPQFHLDIITIGRSHSTLAVRDWLDGGGLVGLLGDRVLGAEGPRANFIELPFLGHAARFSDGPLAAGDAAAPARGVHGRAVPRRAPLRGALRAAGRFHAAEHRCGAARQSAARGAASLCATARGAVPRGALQLVQLL